MMKYWLDMGVDGFRLDVVNLLSKDQNFPMDDFKTVNRDGRRFYTDGPRIHEYLKLLNENVFSKYKNIMTVGEMSSTDIENCIEYTKQDNKELDMVFNFHHLKVDYKNGDKWSLDKFNFKELKDLLFKWQVEMEDGKGWNALFWCNHDQPRIVSRFGNDEVYRTESAKMLGTAIQLMRGTPYIYQGEEIGMTNPNFNNIEEYRDVESLNAYELLIRKGFEREEAINIIKNRSRDNSRTPMQWTCNENSGFTKGKPWISLAENYRKINVSLEKENKDSILNYYKDLIRLRENSKTISEGKFIPILKDHSKIFAYIRESGNEKILVVCNFYGEKTMANIEELKNIKTIILNNCKENKIEDEFIFLEPYGSMVVYI